MHNLIIGHTYYSTNHAYPVPETLEAIIGNNVVYRSQNDELKICKLDLFVETTRPSFEQVKKEQLKVKKEQLKRKLKFIKSHISDHIKEYRQMQKELKCLK